MTHVYQKGITPLFLRLQRTHFVIMRSENQSEWNDVVLITMPKQLVIIYILFQYLFCFILWYNFGRFSQLSVNLAAVRCQLSFNKCVLFKGKLHLFSRNHSYFTSAFSLKFPSVNGRLHTTRDAESYIARLDKRDA